MRRHLAAAVAGLFAQLEVPSVLPELSTPEEERLVALGALAARARSAVERDSMKHEIELIPDAEAPARLAQALRRLYGGLLVIGLTPSQAWPHVIQVGLDCMPKLRRGVFNFLVRDDAMHTTTECAVAVRYPAITARRALVLRHA